MMSVTEKVIREQFVFWQKALHLPVPTLGEKVVVTGCGTSFYLAQTLAALLNQSGRIAIAVPGSEWMLRQDCYLSDPLNWTILGLSRSGTTTETVAALRKSSASDLRTVALTCEPDAEISKAAQTSLHIPTHPSEGIVMSASASLMLLAGMRMAGVALPPDLPARSNAMLQALDTQIDQFMRGRRHFVYLGGGARYGVACEGALKLMEMSITPAQAFHPMEYRHGPISLIDAGSVIVMLYSPETIQTFAEETALVRELQAKGALVVGIDGPGDLCLTTGMVGPGAILAALPALQLIGERVAIAKGINTETPRHLSKVVVLA